MLGHRRTFIGRLWGAALFWVAAALSQIGSMLIFAPGGAGAGQCRDHGLQRKVYQGK